MIFSQLYHGENKFHSMRWWWGPLYTIPTRFVGFFLVLAAGRHIDPLGHVKLIPSHLRSLCSYSLKLRAEQISILKSLVWPGRDQNPRYRTRGGHHMSRFKSRNFEIKKFTMLTWCQIFQISKVKIWTLLFFYECS